MNRAALPLVLSGLLAVTPALADNLGAKRGRAMVERGEILALEEILKRHLPRLGGRIIEIEIEVERGAYVYEIKVLRPDGRYRELEINARTGALIKEE